MLRAALTGTGTAAALTCAAAAALPATEHTPSGLTVLRLLPAGVAGAVPRHAKTKLAHAAASWLSGGSPQHQGSPQAAPGSGQSAAWAALAGHIGLVSAIGAYATVTSASVKRSPTYIGVGIH